MVFDRFTGARAERLQRLQELEQRLRQSSSSAHVDQSFTESATGVLALSQLVEALADKVKTCEPFVNEVRAVQTTTGSLFASGSSMLQVTRLLVHPWGRHR